MRLACNAFIRLTLTLAGTLLCAAVAAQDFPSRPIVLVAPFPPGGGADLGARVLADGMSSLLKQPVTVENRPGAGTVIGARDVLRANADGYRLLVASASTLAINPFLDKKLDYSIKSFEPVSLIIKIPMIMVTNKSLPVTSLRGFVEYAKQRPGELSYGSTGAGTTAHLATELFAQAAGIKLNHIPYKGGAPAQADVLSGTLHLYVDGLTGTILQHHKAGNLRALASFSEKREDSLPEVPTLVESGYPDVLMYTWVGLVAKAGTPAAVIDTLNSATVRVLQMPNVQARFVQNGLRASPSTVREFTALIERDGITWKSVIDRLGLSLELN